MARPRTVQAHVLKFFMEHPDESFSVLDLVTELSGYNASQISHSLSALLNSGEISRDGKRKPLLMENGCSKRFQFYRLVPDRQVDAGGVCRALDIDPRLIESAPFELSNRLEIFFLVQQALLGSARGAKFEQVRKQRYGAIK